MQDLRQDLAQAMERARCPSLHGRKRRLIMRVVSYARQGFAGYGLLATSQPPRQRAHRHDRLFHACACCSRRHHWCSSPGFRDPFRWFAGGVRDLGPRYRRLLTGTCFWGMALVLGWVFRPQPEYTMSLASGCLLVGRFGHGPV